MVPAGSSLFTFADRPPFDKGESRVGPMRCLAVGGARTSRPDAEPFPGYLVVSSARRARAVSHERRAESR